MQIIRNLGGITSRFYHKQCNATNTHMFTMHLFAEGLHGWLLHLSELWSPVACLSYVICPQSPAAVIYHICGFELIFRPVKQFMKHYINLTLQFFKSKAVPRQNIKKTNKHQCTCCPSGHSPIIFSKDKGNIVLLNWSQIFIKRTLYFIKITTMICVISFPNHNPHSTHQIQVQSFDKELDCSIHRLLRLFDI